MAARAYVDGSSKKGTLRLQDPNGTTLGSQWHVPWDPTPVAHGAPWVPSTPPGPGGPPEFFGEPGRAGCRRSVPFYSIRLHARAQPLIISSKSR